MRGERVKGGKVSEKGREWRVREQEVREKENKVTQIPSHFSIHSQSYLN